MKGKKSREVSSNSLKQILSEIRRQNSIESFREYIGYVDPDYIFNWHHEIFIQKLELFIEGSIKNLAVFMPPQHGKTELALRKLVPYMFGLDPSLLIAGCSYSASLAQRFGRQIQREMDNDIYQDIFPETILPTNKDPEPRTSSEFGIAGQDGLYIGVGVGGGIAGNRVDIGIIEDPVKDRAQAESKVFRERNWEWYTDAFKTRLHNDSQKLLSTTRWHEDDLAGRILKEEKDWEVVSFTAVKDIKDPSDPRKMGEALWPERHSYEKMEPEMKHERTWSSLYQQRPAPIKGNIIKKKWFNITTKLFNVPSSYYLDAAYTDDTGNDPSAIMEYKYFNGRLQICCVWLFWLEAPELLIEIKKIIGKKGSKLTIEPKASGLTIYQLLNKDPDLYVAKDKAPTDSKPVRAHGVAPFMAKGFVEVIKGDWNDNFFDECKVFPNGSHDDQVDCLTAICRICFIENLAEGLSISGHEHGSI